MADAAAGQMEHEELGRLLLGWQDAQVLAQVSPWYGAGGELSQHTLKSSQQREMAGKRILMVSL